MSVSTEAPPAASDVHALLVGAALELHDRIATTPPALFASGYQAVLPHTGGRVRLIAERSGVTHVEIDGERTHSLPFAALNEPGVVA